MNNSEKLLSNFAEKYFTDELVIAKLHYTPEGGSELELADLIINLDDIVIAIQLKSRNANAITEDTKAEKRWVEKKCEHARQQVKKTIACIRTGKLPTFKNIAGQEIAINNKAKVIPLVIFDNHKICEYARILERTQDNNKINCISYSDFQEMCKNIVSPIEIVEYLEYRQAFYNNYPNCDMYVDLNEKHIGIVKPKSKESLSRFFSVEKYGLSGISSIEKNAKRYNAFLQSLCKSDEFKSTPFEAYKTVCFLAHLSRIEMSAFIKRFNRAKWISRLKINRIVGSFRRKNGDYMIFFIAAKNECGGGRHEDLLSCVENPKTIEKVFQVIIYWESITTYRVKMILSDT